jgi:predicted DNA-binding transcriptional regulator AlpA
MPPQDGAPLQIADLDVSRLSRAECAALLAQSKALEGRLLARLLTTDESATREITGDGDRLLTIEQAAQLLSVTRSWLYHHAKRLGLAVRLGSGTLRFSHARILQYMLESAVKPRTRSTSKASRCL